MKEAIKNAEVIRYTYGDRVRIGFRSKRGGFFHLRSTDLSGNKDSQISESQVLYLARVGEIENLQILSTLPEPDLAELAGTDDGAFAFVDGDGACQLVVKRDCKYWVTGEDKPFFSIGLIQEVFRVQLDRGVVKLNLNRIINPADATLSDLF